ncbi:Aste57867_23822 [Aphanomyces stellatus]|uniref:Aste57867_23822 protein n=1 Tax=Aphanomyces stellatus TaxID=120398 RepID=A0A485LNN6_9STRA|nr:hypothetical protein As57867_023749 [Aphanomyces stellatus]VFU00466.1 Aste57867_23822 [Aphanomyces stellatus]
MQYSGKEHHHHSLLKEWWSKVVHPSHHAECPVSPTLALPDMYAHEKTPNHLVGGKHVPFLPAQAAHSRHHQEELALNFDPIDENKQVDHASPLLTKPAVENEPPINVALAMAFV